jgi:hypothetical protein
VPRETVLKVLMWAAFSLIAALVIAYLWQAIASWAGWSEG